MVDDVVRLGARERVPDRPFTDPERSVADLAAIRAMAVGLRGLADRPWPGGPGPLVLELGGADGLGHRAIVTDARLFAGGRDLAFIGFFAEKRPELDPAPLTVADDELITEFPRHPGILSYSSLQFPDSNWGNLIVVEHADTADRWREGERHARAARELAPRHYRFVRLHHGRFPGGIRSGHDPRLLRTRYLDFQGPAPWQAERLLGPDAGTR
jgi:hypothetical protein